jgi:hypothetical protein
MNSAALTTLATAVRSLPAPLDIFRVRCEAREHLYAVREIADLHDAVDALQDHTVNHGLVRQISQDAAQGAKGTDRWQHDCCVKVGQRSGLSRMIDALTARSRSGSSIKGSA